MSMIKGGIAENIFYAAFIMNDIIDTMETISEEDDDEQRRYSRYEGTPLLLAVQLTVSILAIIVMFGFKFIGGESFNTIKNWYIENINNALVAGDDIKGYKEAFSRDIPFANNENKENVITTSCINSQNNMEKVPIELTTVMSKPIENGIITSRFGKRNDPITGVEKVHYGLDIGASEGTPIYAVMPGTVEKAENSPSFGNVLIIDHGNNIKTLYAHCKELKVRVGDTVKRRQIIASMGNTGYYSTGTHLHVELIINGTKYDPEPFFENICV